MDVAAMETTDSARYSMYSHLAYLASGGHAKLRLEKPKVFKHGETAQNRLGDAVMRVDPSLEPEAFFSVFLHELAHVFLRHVEGDKSLSNPRMEHDAQLLASAWAALAEERHDKSIELRLTRLIYHFRQSKKRS